MTKEERKLALYCLKASSDYHSEVCEECINYPNCDHTIQDDVTETVIKELEQEPCEDAISRESVIEYIEASEADLGHDSENELVCQDIKELPSVNPQPKTGHWVDIMVGDMPSQVCDRCNTFYPLAYTGGGHKYCPNCGAKMKEVEE